MDVSLRALFIRVVFLDCSVGGSEVEWKHVDWYCRILWSFIEMGKSKSGEDGEVARCGKECGKEW